MPWFPRISLKVLKKSPPFNSDSEIEIEFFVYIKGHKTRARVIVESVIPVLDGLGITPDDSYDIVFVKRDSEEFIP